MKTHELAKSLQQLSRILLAAPNVELSDVELQSVESVASRTKEQMAVNLTTLLELSRIDKKRWVGLIEEHNFPIPTEARDSSRNIMDKVLRYLNSNPVAAESLKRSTAKKTGRGSSELSQALASLLKDNQ